jgi:hypothetical protein
MARTNSTIPYLSVVSDNAIRLNRAAMRMLGVDPADGRAFIQFLDNPFNGKVTIKRTRTRDESYSVYAQTGLAGASKVSRTMQFRGYKPGARYKLTMKGRSLETTPEDMLPEVA